MTRKIVVSCQLSFDKLRTLRRRTLSKIEVSVVSILFLSCSVCFAEPISSSELINNAKLYDGKTVVYEGEVIGDVMARGAYAWVNLNDGRNAIGIWTRKDLAGDIIHTGNYKARGDWIEVTGVFNRACAEHGGDLDIHAQAIRKLAGGRPLLERLNLSKRNLAFILVGVLCLVWILSLLKLK